MQSFEMLAEGGCHLPSTAGNGTERETLQPTHHPFSSLGDQDRPEEGSVGVLHQCYDTVCMCIVHAARPSLLPPLSQGTGKGQAVPGNPSLGSQLALTL